MAVNIFSSPLVSFIKDKLKGPPSSQKVSEKASMHL